ncbi:MAG: hypothetical protein INR62_01780 [Rhodospirillales bacterium]|nr:hypothetical protein [Acetobacter sp.]
MPEPSPIRRADPQDKEIALDNFATQLRQIKEHKQALRSELDAALTTITQAICQHWSTGGGTRLRQIVWSLWNGDTPVGLYYVLGGLDYELACPVAKLLEAWLVGAVDDDKYLRRVLTESGEFDRYNRAKEETPEGEEVIYPPLPISADRLRDLAEAATSKEARYKAEAARLEAASA